MGELFNFDPQEHDSGLRTGRKIISKKGRWLLRKILYFMSLGALRQKLRNGIWPSMAPNGYINDKNPRSIMVNRDKAKLIKKAFELYATGEYPLAEIRKIVNGLGLTGKKNMPLSIGNYLYMLESQLLWHYPVQRPDLRRQA